MTELQTILETWRTLEQDGLAGVLATVVHVTGSAYRRPGARMLLLADGRRVGTVSGGCLEGELCRKAWWHTESARPVVRVYDTSSSDDAIWEFGLGCNGVVHVMLERIGTHEASDTLGFLAQRQRNRQTAVVATLIAAPAGAEASIGERLLLDEHGVCGGTLRTRGLASEVAAHAQRALAQQESRLAHIEGHAVFVECVTPPLELLVLGAGDDVKPLVAMASTLGWRVTVADGRPAYARAERFPATRVNVLDREAPLAGLEITPDTCVVMMTHNYPLDVRLLPGVLAKAPQYLGLLGPRHRAARLFEELGIEPPGFVHAPAGLDMGGDAPAAVALSIVAEIQAVVNARAGGKLRHREEAIHAAVTETGDVAALTFTAERPAFCETLVSDHAA